MVLRSGCIIPFQFRDCKKLLMIGIPEENRDLSIWDLKNVVRAAFGIYNFEFRNKKIGFNIPDELLLHYLAQRHDLTNFVIEVGQAHDDIKSEDYSSYEPPEAHAQIQTPKLNMSIQQKSSETTACDMPTSDSCMASETPAPAQESAAAIQHVKSPLELANISDHSNNEQPPYRLRISQLYSDNTPESLTHSIDPMDIVSKTENNKLGRHTHDAREPHQLQPQPQQQQQQSSSNYFSNYNLSMMSSNQPSLTSNTSSTPTPAPNQHQYSSAMMNRFRRRGERMSKDQKEIYVKYFEENPCMLSQRRNDAMLEPHWNRLASMLNSVPQGAAKNVEEWKQTFDAWRYRVFMYTRYNSKLTGTVAQNPKNFKPLTTTDQRAYAMWTSHKNTTPQDFEKMENMFGSMDETQTDYGY